MNRVALYAKPIELSLQRRIDDSELSGDPGYPPEAAATERRLRISNVPADRPLLPVGIVERIAGAGGVPVPDCMCEAIG
jgi:hypothetical protein